MHRRTFLEQSALYTTLLTGPWMSRYGMGGLNRQSQIGTSTGPIVPVERGAPTPAPIPEPHFPDRLHLFVWRNWELANADRMAQILGTTSEKVLEMGASMGLPEKNTLSEDQLRRIYVTVIRQNWHILPEEQLIELLGWSRGEYDYHLREDDFLWIKLGALKPRCESLIYHSPAVEAKSRASEIKRLVDRTFGPRLREPEEPPFEFVRELSAKALAGRMQVKSEPSEGEIDLSSGWVLVTPKSGDSTVLELAGAFQSYLKSVFGCDLVSGTQASPGSKVLRFSLDTSMAPSASFLITVQREDIQIVASDSDDLREAVYDLENRMEERQGPYLAEGEIRRTTSLNPRYVYSYFALYGDPLIEEDIDPFPEGFLERLARAGINGVWLQAILRNLAPSRAFPEFGKECETRLRNLNKLIERASHYGVKVYFYINEPRSMPAAFFARRPDIKGTHDPGNTQFFAMCTSTEKVRQWLGDSLAHLFTRAPGLGGIFCITASENLTNCYSHGHAEFCPRCSKRNGSEVVAEVIQTFRDGVRRSSAAADVIAWDWGWGKDWIRNGAETQKVIPELSKDVAVMSVSEWGKAIDRGGFKTQVGEYSVSVVGPGPRATRTWQLAREGHNAAFAKVQWDNSWEISAVPYIPVPNLIIEHCENLAKAGVQGLMASWTLGGYPSPNFEAAREFYFTPISHPEDVLRRIAARRYGLLAAEDVCGAWRAFSEAFSQYPMDGGALVYHIPTQHGPANLLRLRPTGYKATMILFPYDDYNSWVGPYPVQVVESQFAKMARQWEPGLDRFRKALSKAAPGKRKTAQKDLGIAETCYLHFRSVANQIHFYRLRDQWLTEEGETRRKLELRMIEVARQEIELAKRQYAIAKEDSMIAFEASNHYYYRPLDLVEKVLNCQYVISQLSTTEGVALG